MGAHLRSFRVAFWALLSAFGLSVVLQLTDPRAVRLAILARHRPPAEHTILASAASSAATAAGGTTRSSEGERPLSPATAAGPSDDSQPAWIAESEDPSPASPDGAPLDAALVRKVPGDESLPSPERPAADGRGLATARPVSSPFGGAPQGAEAGSIRRDGSMPILAPTGLQHSAGRGDYFELPPPPAWVEVPVPQPETVTLDSTRTGRRSLRPTHNVFSADVSSADRSSRTAPAVEVNDRLMQDRLLQHRLDAEIASLRREVERLAQTQHIGQQLDQLQRQTEQILKLHQQLPIDRLMQLLDLLLIELQSVRATIPPAHEARSTRTSENLPPEASSSRSPGDPDPSRTTEARLNELLRMLAPLSDPSVTSVASAPEGGAPRDARPSVSEVPAPLDAEWSRADGPHRTRQNAETATQNPSAREAELIAPIHPAEDAAVANSTAPTDWQVPLLHLDKRSTASPGSKRGAPPVSANDDPAWTAAASSCVDCHRAKGIR